MSKNVAKFRKPKDYNEEYAFKTNTYDRKQRDKQKDSKKQKYHDSYDPDWHNESLRYRK